jgi:protein-S-isoprenylcysteine O-methyltransferase
MMAVFFLSPLEYLFFDDLLPRSAWTKSIGVLLVLSGIVLFVWARRALGQNYAGHVSAREGQDLVQSGPYRFLRHPAYAGYFLMALGISLGYSSLIGLAALLLLFVPVLVYRIRVEEKVLAAHFGKEWLAYSRRVPAILPRLKS